MNRMTDFPYRWFRPLGNVGQFWRPITELKLHPQLEQIADIVPAEPGTEPHQIQRARFTPVEILSAEDAKRSGEPENAETVLFGTQAINLNSDYGRVRAKYSQLPENMDASEYILRRYAAQSINIGQRAFVALALRRVLFDKDVGKDGRESKRAECWADCTKAARRGAGVSSDLMEQAEKLGAHAEDLAGRVRARELKMHEALFMLCNRRQREEYASGASSVQDRLIALCDLAEQLSGKGDEHAAEKIRQATAALHNLVADPDEAEEEEDQDDEEESAGERTAPPV